MIGRLLAGLMVAALAGQPTIEPSSTYASVVAGMKCRQNSMGSLECDYRVGRSLHVNIAGVGNKDASITFMASSFEGDYYASVGIMHGCVIVKPGKAIAGRMFDFAFVSPRSGKVYLDWESCQRAE